MKSSSQLLLEKKKKKMNLDEQLSENADKQMLIQLVNGNVTVLTQNKIQKGQFLLPFFLFVRK